MYQENIYVGGYFVKTISGFSSSVVRLRMLSLKLSKDAKHKLKSPTLLA